MLDPFIGFEIKVVHPVLFLRAKASALQKVDQIPERSPIERTFPAVRLKVSVSSPVHAFVCGHAEEDDLV